MGGRPRLTLEIVQGMAAEKNGKFLSAEYTKSKDNFTWGCENGHTWTATANSIQRGTWCPYCAKRPPLGIKDMHETAAKKGGRFLSEKYVNVMTIYEWECAEGHTWKTSANSIRSGDWCARCSGLAPLTNEDMHNEAKKFGGYFISDKYVNTQTKHAWRCSEGHEFEATPSNVRNGGYWCPHCAGVARRTMDDMHAIAARHGGKFLSETYTNRRQKYKWECSEGHTFESASASLTGGSWCAECAGTKPLTIEDMHETARKMGGYFKSDSYSNSISKYKWECAEGHEWQAVASSVRAGYWCPECSGRTPWKIEEVQEFAANLGGKLVSQSFSGINPKYTWQCGSGHEWEASGLNILHNGTWCPECYSVSNHRGQELCRELMEQRFSAKFLKSRPMFMRSTTGRILELDGYNKALAIAFEYQGDQHYKPIPSWGGMPVFLEIQRRDREKVQLCIENNVRLVIVPKFTNLNDRDRCAAELNSHIEKASI